jgi:hypothetical protein
LEIEKRKLDVKERAKKIILIKIKKNARFLKSENQFSFPKAKKKKNPEYFETTKENARK